MSIRWKPVELRERYLEITAWLDEPRSIGEKDRLYEAYEMAADELAAVSAEYEQLTGKMIDREEGQKYVLSKGDHAQRRDSGSQERVPEPPGRPEQHVDPNR